MEAFARFYSTRGSWYKLRAYPPQQAFQFYLDPGAAMVQEKDERGRLRVFPSTVKAPAPTGITTSNYRDCFGWLDAKSVSDAPANPDNMFLGDAPLIYVPQERALAYLPAEILDAGRTQVSAVIHPRAAALPESWLHAGAAGRLTTWPEECGGRAAVEGILERCREIDGDRSLQEKVTVEEKARLQFGALSGVDWPLLQMLAPERERQLGDMVGAMQRVCDLVWSR